MSDSPASPSPATPPFSSRYRLVRLLGTGGMGEVFLAEDTVLGRRVALKRLAAAAGADGAELLREARAAARIQHPHIATIYDAAADDDGRPFISMEYLEGGHLAGPARAEELRAWTAEIASALDAAHRSGIVHRDLKPSNLMRDADGRVKIVDFGIAKRVAAAAGDGATRSVSVAVEAQLVGTVPYMSPEQATAKAVDARSDLFSLGVVLYELAAGRRPFTGETPLEVIAAIVHRDAPPLDAAVPHDLRAIIERCLKKRPDERFPSAADLLEELCSASSAETVRHNLPAVAATFVGRETELAEILGLLRTRRLLTITGVGGAGKTRLAFEAARRVLSEFRDGVRQASLAPTGPGLVASAVADALGLKVAPGRTVTERVTDGLAGREMLVVLDNCEHVVDESAALVSAILAAAPRVRVLATSREALNVAGEQAWAIPPLSIPPRGLALEAASASRFDAVRLFADRAASSDPRFALSDSNLDAVVTICSRLDGIPLAIELAAARVRAIDVSEIRKRLDDCFQLLTSGARGALPRHQTLRAAVDWSYDLLSEDERRLFGRVAIFAGGFDLDAAESVAGSGAVATESVLDGLARLVDKSLVVHERFDRGVARYRLLEPIRQYASERLDASGERDGLEARRFEHFAAFGDRIWLQRIDAAAAGLQSLEREHENLRAALLWAEREHPPGSLRLAGALGWFWHLHSHFEEGCLHLERALAIPSGPTAERARALYGAAVTATYLGRHEEAKRRALESVSIYRSLGDDTEATRALAAVGWSLWWEARYAEAAATFEECIERFGRLGHRALRNEAKLSLCQVLVSTHDTARAEPLARETLAVAEQLGDVTQIHFARHFLGDCALMRGEAPTAHREYAEALRAAREYGDRFECVYEVQGVAMALALLGRDARALRLVGAAEAQRETLGSTVKVAFWIELLARHIGAAEARLGPDAAAGARREGRAMRFDAAMDDALSIDQD